MNKRIPLPPRLAPPGFTYVELLVALAIGALLLAGLDGVMGQALQSRDQVAETNRLTRAARFALQRMTGSTLNTRRLLLPLADNPATNWPENLREETVPASAPIGSSTRASAVLALALPAYVDLDQDGFPDADDDRDGLIDEDFPNDNQLDYAAGILLIDDDGDGAIDEGNSYDDDEDGADNEDPLDGIDNDGDGSIDEDTPIDMNGDGCPGICGVDDDFSGVIDGGGVEDDDEGGGSYEDPLDPVVFYLSGDRLIERTPVPWDADGDSIVDGRDFSESVIAKDVTRLRVERLPASAGPQLVDLVIELTSPLSGETVRLQTRLRVGGAL